MKAHLLRGACFALALFMTVPPTRAATTPPIAKVPGSDSVRALTLANGMRIIVLTDRDIPNVALYNWVRVGSRNEVSGKTGLAHFFEHMMFNGTSTREQGAFDREMAARGGSNNAFTSDDVTVYQDWFPRTALELVFELEADRLANLAFDPQVIENERGVVYSERRLRTEDNTGGFLAEQVQATAFVAHPYQFPTIGWPSDIKSWTIEDLRSFFETYYAPNNCTIVVVGAVEAEEAFALARKHFEPIPRKEPPPAVRTKEPEQVGEKRVRVVRRAQTPLLFQAYKAPAATDPRAATISILSVVLTGGDASRLHRQLVEEQKLAVDIGAYWQEGFDPGLFWLQATLPEGGDPAVLEAAIDVEIDRIARQGISAAELDRAKNLLTAGFWKQVATIDGKASLLGEYEVIHGDYRKLFDVPAQMALVTRDDVQAVAVEILDRKRRTVGVLVPQTKDDATAVALTVVQ